MRINPLAWPTFVLASLAFWIGIVLKRRARHKSSNTLLLGIALIAATPGLVYVLYYTHLFDSVAWFYNFRAVSHTELLASGVGLLGGVLYAIMEPDTTGEKLFIPLVTFATIFVPFMKPVLEPLDFNRLSDHCDGEYCLQSTESTCGPTSVANLLKSFGINASEKELAVEAFTYRGGTENWYLVRALRDRGLAARVVIQKDLKAIPAPSIAGVILPGGAGHFIAIKSVSDQSVSLVDPLKGSLVVPRDQLGRVYHFTGLFLKLVPR
jgi:hypothetical protein